MTPSRDRRTAYRLARLLKAVQAQPRRRAQSRMPYPAGPAALMRFSAGVLVVETIRHVIDHPAAPRDHLAYEFARRGLNETADLVQNNDFTQPLDWDMPKDPNLDKAITRLEAVNDASYAMLDSAGRTLDYNDEAALDQVKTTMLSPSEQIDDLVAVGADHDTIAAFIEAQGVSDVSASTAMATTTDMALDQNEELTAAQQQDQSHTL